MSTYYLPSFPKRDSLEMSSKTTSDDSATDLPGCDAVGGSGPGCRT